MASRSTRTHGKPYTLVEQVVETVENQIDSAELVYERKTGFVNHAEFEAHEGKILVEGDHSEVSLSYEPYEHSDQSIGKINRTSEGVPQSTIEAIEYVDEMARSTRHF